ncbi:hypothetical protein GCM10027589_27740 [Actinocorallia lasiicapitis]
MKKILLAAALAVALPAPAVAAPAWRPVFTAQFRGHDSFTALASGGKNSAWALGVRTGTGSLTRVIAYHWNGRSWKRAAFPALPVARPWDFEPAPILLDASSPAAAWALLPGAFAEDRRDRGDLCVDGPLPPLPLKPERASHLLRWDGRRFVTAAAVKDVVVSAVISDGARKAWAFGSTDSLDGVTLRYDGRRWTRAKAPIRVERATRIGGLIWAYGHTPSGTPVLSRFDGRRWRTVPTGRLLTDWNEGPKTKGRTTHLTSLAALPGGGVMIGGRYLDLNPCLWEGEIGRWRSFTHRWSKGVWRTEQPKALRGWSPERQIPDGKGGTYVMASQLWSTEDSHPDVLRVFHRTSAARWTSLPASPDLRTIALIGGHLLAGGRADGRYDTNAVLWRR